MTDVELKSVARLLDKYKAESNSISIYHMIKCYLRELSVNYEQKWSHNLDNIYLRLFEYVNRHYELLDSIMQMRDEHTFLADWSIMLVYVELEYSKFKELLSKQKNNIFKKVDPVNEKFLDKIMFIIQQLEIYLSIYLRKQSSIVEDLDEKLTSASKYFLIRSKISYS